MDAMLLEHMMNPKNYGVLEHSNAEGIGKNPHNGEKVIVFLDVSNKGDFFVIEDIRFQAIGCMTTVLAGSIITSEAKGLDFDKAEALVSTTLGMLDTIPSEEAACSEMVALALQAAIDTYKERQKDIDFPMITYKIAQNCTPKGEDADE
ncbi:MAG: iron-sulfur cluster assembly scaffold protein [Sulfurovaceae bacterium]|nr:iron-sulfur cluster assembly scaffold protein [Sulfurovaceae bacterium]